MAKGTIKKVTGLFFCWMGLMAAVCVPSFIAGFAHSEPGDPVTVLNASVVGVDSGFIPTSNAAGHERAGQAVRQQAREDLDRI